MHIHLETERLVLRRFTMDDVDNLVDLDGDPEVMHYLTGGTPTPREQIAERSLPTIVANYERYDLLGTWAVQDRAGEFLGWFELWPDGDRAEFGYRLRKPFWGRGLATEGGRAVLHRAFTGSQLPEAYAETMFVNHRSRRVLEKCGLRHVRTFHQHFEDPIPGTEYGEVEYAVTREEWLRADR